MTADRSHRRDPLAFAAGGGEMGERLRSFDWSQTPLGALETWPQSLRSAVSLLLPSRAQIILFWGPDFVTIYNDAYRPVFGAKHPGALGLPARESWSEIWDSQLRELLEGVRNTGEAYWASDLAFFLMRFGYLEETYFDISYDPVRDETGDVGGVLCIVTETTQRVLSERRLKALRDLSSRTLAEARSGEAACRIAAQILAENASDSPFSLIYLLDSDETSARLAGVTGLAEGSAAAPPRIELGRGGSGTGWPLDAAFQTRSPQLATELGGRFGALPGGVWPEPTDSAVVLPIVKSGRHRLAGFLVAGISPRRALDDSYRDFLDLVAAQIGTAIANARAHEEEKRRAESLAELDRAKTAFFSNVSHEFRTPLTLMLGPVHDLLVERGRTLSPAVADQLDVVNRNGQRLLRLVNTLLDFSRIQAGRAHAVYQPLDLAAFTTDLASTFRSACERAGLLLSVNCPPLSEPAYVDRDMWEKIVLNLLSNAFKFTFEGEIALSLRQVGTAAELRLRDTGTGIPAEEMPRLFERFHRVQNARARTHEGSGIGLALVQELIALHGGSIAVESEVGKGTTFTVTLPLGSSHLPQDQLGEAGSEPSTATTAIAYVEEALRWLPDATSGVADGAEDLPLFAALPVARRDGEADPGNRRPRVLVADDNADMRRYASRLLAPHFQVEAVPDGEAALAAARERAPDLVLTDVMMPRLDGFGLLRALREDPSLSAIPVVLVSARAGEEARIEGMEAGADDYLIKPFSARELVARIDANVKVAAVRRESEQRFRSFADTAPAMLWVTEPDGRSSFLSRGWYEFTGQSPATGLGFGWLDAVHPDDRDASRETFIAATARREPFALEHRLRRNDGQYRWVIDAGRPRFGSDGEFLGYTGSVIDIDERKQAEEALREADRRKDEFLATLSHELRNPLAPIRNALSILDQAPDAATSAQTRELLERQVGQMVRLVDDLLDVSRISRGKLELRRERVELSAILEQALETCRPLSNAAGHDVSVALPPVPVFLDADPLRLGQVFGNLLHNACKFTERGGRIRLGAELRGREVVVSVADTGIGIPAEAIGSIFEMFEQVDKTLERPQAGLGVGLTIVKRLVELHGGRIEARSDGLGRGTEFIVRLPVAVMPAREPGSPADSSAAGPATTRRRVLVVDDNRDSAESLAALLKLSSHEISTANDGEAAVEAAEKLRPDVILLDIGMPTLNGYEACRRIRALPGGADVLIIALTGWGQVEDRRKSSEAGFDGHLVKPVDHAALLRMLEPAREEPA